MRNLNVVFWICFGLWLVSFFVPAYLLPEGPVIGYRCSWVPLTGVTEGSIGGVLGTLANFFVWGVVILPRLIKKRGIAFALTSLTLISTFSWFFLLEEMSTENLLVGYWLWAFTSPMVVWLQHLRIHTS
jgi:hypothetical protein